MLKFSRISREEDHACGPENCAPVITRDVIKVNGKGLLAKTKQAHGDVGQASTSPGIKRNLVVTRAGAPTRAFPKAT